MEMKSLVSALARGVGQVMFQSSVLSGALMAAGIVAGSIDRPVVALCALVALVAGTVAAKATKTAGTTDGLQGFNAVLVGCATGTFLATGAGTWLLLLAGALLTLPAKKLLDKLCSTAGQSSYTLPFIICTWAVLIAARVSGAAHPFVAESIAETAPVSVLSLAIGLLKGVSEVFLIDSRLAGALMLAGLACASPRTAILALVGSATGMSLAALFGCPWAEISMGLWGFSPVLTAIAIGGIQLKDKRMSARLLHYCILALALSLTVLLQLCLTPLLALIGLPILTLPFCLATLATLAILR